MPKNPNVKRVMVIGSGPIVIGQAAEFDYAGTQACRSLKEEGIVSGGMLPKLDNAFSALNAGVHNVRITSATAPEGGTLITLKS